MQVPDHEDAKAFLEYADRLKDEPVIIIDLRFNMGGYPGLPGEWLKSYMDKNVPSNFYFIQYGTPMLINVRRINDNLGLAFEQPDSFVESVR